MKQMHAVPPVPYVLNPLPGCVRGTAGIDERYARQWLQGAKWAAITIVNVGSPVLGKTSQACSPASSCRRYSAPELQKCASSGKRGHPPGFLHICRPMTWSVGDGVCVRVRCRWSAR